MLNIFSNAAKAESEKQSMRKWQYSENGEKLNGEEMANINNR